MKKNLRKPGRRILLTICIMLAVSVGLTAFPGGAFALTSLPHIEEIVSSDSTGTQKFQILEIVPEEGSGSIGYYVNGQEPLKNLGYLLNGLKSEEERSSAVSRLFDQLKAKKILSSDQSTPMTLDGAVYTEKKPWQLTAEEWQSMTELSLPAPETATVSGTFTGSDSGDYDKVMKLDADNSTSNQVQKIDFFQFYETEETAPKTGKYYYSPVFYPITNGQALPDGTAIYTNSETGSIDENGNVIPATGADPTDGNYQYVGSWGEDGFILNVDEGVVYYTAGASGHPVASWDLFHPYAAVSADFTQVPAGEGYFSLVGYRFAGKGLGHYTLNITPEGTDTVTVTYDTVWYSLGCRNHDWFLKYVFDQIGSDGNLTDAGKNVGIAVQSKIPSEVTDADVRKADLIILSAGLDLSGAASRYQAGNDIDALGSGGVYDAIAAADQEKVPVLIDGSILTSGAGTNIASLATKLKDGNAATDFVSENIYCFSGNLATADFNQKFSDTAGFADVLAEIENENFLRKKDNPSTTDLLTEEVTMANSIRYVINYSGQRRLGAQEEITVLELEPGRGKRLTSDIVREWLGGDSSGIAKEKIHIVAMSTSEFIGKIDDMVETYDMIYVGSDLTGFHTTGNWAHKTTVYNDSNLDGLVYTNIGDVYYADMQLAGLLDRDYYKDYTGNYPTWHAGGKQYRYIDATSGTAANRFRFSGNDLTQSKASELLDFVKSGYPVVLADDLDQSSGAGSITVNTDRVDRASLMYSALTSIQGYHNVMTVSDTSTQSATLLKYLNLSKPSIEWQKYPPVYSRTDSGDGQPVITGLTPKNGKYFLEYGFTIQNQTDASPKDTTYDCRLSIDLNADGRYKSNEQIQDIIIRDADGRLMTPVRTGSGVYRYELKAARRYTLTRQIPEDYTGIIPWKLEVVKNDNEYIHASEVNYTHVSPDTAEKIHILQINSDYNVTLNLQNQLDSSNRWSSYYSYGATRTINGASQTRYFHGLFGKLLYEAADFDVRITTMSAENFNSRRNQSEYLDSFNMLIIGFSDMYQELSKDSANAVVDFIGSGKSVLFTHDTTSLVNVPSVYANRQSFVSSASRWGLRYDTPSFSDPANWGYYFNTILRDAVKLDRYGIRSRYRSALQGQTSGTNLTQTAAQQLTQAGYSVAYTPDSSRSETKTEAETQGCTNYSLIRYGKNNQQKVTADRYSGGRVTKKVSQVNQGQITTYPYDINTEYFKNGTGRNTMTVAPTHEQYYQLNMNSNDIVVWYCLSNGDTASPDQYYAATPNDAVNSYYIYNCGNITYSGMGHFTSGCNPEKFYTGGNLQYINEAKLFVNTMIASYRAGAEKATVHFTTDASGKKTAHYFFVTLDYNTGDSGDLSVSGQMLDLNSKIHFTISDSTLSHDKDLTPTFYYTRVDASNHEVIKNGIIETTSFTPTVANAETGGPVTQYAGGRVYQFLLPAEILSAVKQTENSAVNLYVNVDSGGVCNPSADSKIQLRRIGLFELD
ncbi:MAG: DUF5057 domain-containing protein [Oscillospiraceae bacterium]|jgi:hypothetical protein|nr:DUF5057 domain-containing protein [Oscillospiraceae bacterium]